MLADYCAIAANGGWPRVTEGESLRVGDRSHRVVELRRRFAATMSHEPSVNLDSELFDSDLERLVKDFQVRHNLDSDGVVGKKTIAALNVPVENRISQIRASLERARWLFNDMRVNPDFVIVNIAEFHLALVRDHEVEWKTPVVVGKRYHETPVFKGSMKYLVLNPTWTVPRVSPETKCCRE